MIMLSVRANKDFEVRQQIPTLKSTPKGTYTILFLFLLLWISALVALLVDWPTDSDGYNSTDFKRKKRGFRDFTSASTSAMEGLAWGVFSLDLVFMYVPSPNELLFIAHQVSSLYCFGILKNHATHADISFL
jgi:hypothetical protein